MKKIILILFLSIVTNLVAQKDTLYFNSAWNETTKTEAEFYRPLPLKKVEDLYQIKDYYINGNLQMEGHWSDIENEILQGKVSWYYENGQLNEEREYKNNSPHGKSTYYTKEGFLRAEGEYKNGQAWNGTVPSLCCPGRVSEFKEGDEIAYLTFYKELPQLAKKEVFGEGNISKILYYNKEGKSLGQISYKDDEAVKGRFIWFYMDGELAISVLSYINYTNGKRNGESVTFDKKGKTMAKGICKDDKLWEGQFNDNKTISTYENGQLDGKQISYFSDNFEKIKSYHHYVNGRKEGESAYFKSNGKEIAKGIYKDDKPWLGTFTESCGFFKGSSCKYIDSYKNGQLDGKQVTYYTSDLKIIKIYQHVLNGRLEGESAYFDREGKELAKGIYKNEEPWQGTFYEDYLNTVSSYKDGKKHGMFIQYDSNGKIIAQQEYKDGKRIDIK